VPNRKDSSAGRSGRGIGIPVLGAIGGGDGFQQKIGRPKRPYLSGDGGSPTQSADSNFSSRLSRVNKGREDDAEFAFHDMFPGQSPDVDPDLELEDGLLGLRTEKLPIYFAGMKRIPESNMRKLNIGSPSLAVSLLKEEKIEESFIDDISRLASSAADFAGSAFGATRPLYKLATKTAPQIGSALLGAAQAVPGAGLAATAVGAIPGLDVIYGSASSYYNYQQIKGNVERIDDILSDMAIEDDFISILTGDETKYKQVLDDVSASYGTDRKRLASELERMFGNVKDIAVSIILMSDTLAGSAMANPTVALIGSIASTSAALTTSMITDYESAIPEILNFFTKLPSPFRSIVQKGLHAIDSSLTYDTFLKMIKRSGEIYGAVSESGDSDGEDLYGDESLQEIKRKKKKKIEREASGVGAIAGFTGPMSDFRTAARRKDFEKTAAKSFGGSSIKEIDESSKYIVRGRRSLIKALED